MANEVARCKKFNFGGAFKLLEETKNFAGIGIVHCVRDIYIDHIMYNNPATIVFWSDGSKTVAKCTKDDTYNAETGLAVCVLKKLTSGAAIHALFEDWLPSETNKTVTIHDVRMKHKVENKQ